MKKRTAEFQYQARMELGKASIVVWGYDKSGTFVCKTNYATTVAAPFENRYLLAEIPDYYERLKASYDANLYEQEVLGHYLSQDGTRVYSAFDAKIHVKEQRVNPVLPLLWALDFNVDPMSSVVVQIQGKKIAVLDEIVLRRALTYQACDEFMKRYSRHLGAVQVFGDASGYQQQTTGVSDYQMIRDYFGRQSSLKVEHLAAHSNPPVRDRINVVNAKLQNAMGEVGMMIDPKCQELIDDFEQVLYNSDSRQIDKDRDRQRTHLSDALGYLLWDKCGLAQPIGEQGRRLPVH